MYGGDPFGWELIHLRRDAERWLSFLSSQCKLTWRRDWGWERKTILMKMTPSVSDQSPGQSYRLVGKARKGPCAGGFGVLSGKRHCSSLSGSQKDVPASLQVSCAQGSTPCLEVRTTNNSRLKSRVGEEEEYHHYCY